MFYQIAIRAVNLLWHFWFKLQIFGRENEPKEGGYILASNHCSAIDPMIVTITYCDPKKSFRSRVVVTYGKLITCEELGITSTGGQADLSHARELKEATRRIHAIMEELKTQNL